MSMSPLAPEQLTAAREAAERGRDDDALLELRSLEISASDLPPLIDGARRDRLLCADAISTTWEAWHTDSGARLLLRCVRPEWRRDPVMLRRMSRALQSPDPPQWNPDGAWPHLRVEAPGALLLDRLPVEDTPDTVYLARIMAAGLSGLRRLHAAGLVHGAPLAAHLVEGRSVRLLWLDRFGASGGPSADLAELGRTVAALDPEGLDPVGQLAHDWAELPPPSAADGERLFRRLLAGSLLSARHRIEVASRRKRRAGDLSTLRALTRRLSAALPPPAGTFCVKAERSGVLILIESDGQRVRGGAAASPGARDLPLLYAPDQGLDAQAARAIQRAWSKRAEGDLAQMATVNQLFGATTRAADGLMRWLAATSRLRALRLLTGG